MAVAHASTDSNAMHVLGMCQPAAQDFAFRIVIVISFGLRTRTCTTEGLRISLLQYAPGLQQPPSVGVQHESNWTAPQSQILGTPMDLDQRRGEAGQHFCFSFETEAMESECQHVDVQMLNAKSISTRQKEPVENNPHEAQTQKLILCFTNFRMHAKRRSVELLPTQRGANHVMCSRVVTAATKRGLFKRSTLDEHDKTTSANRRTIAMRCCHVGCLLLTLALVTMDSVQCGWSSDPYGFSTLVSSVKSQDPLPGRNSQVVPKAKQKKLDAVRVLKILQLLGQGNGHLKWSITGKWLISPFMRGAMSSSVGLTGRLQSHADGLTAEIPSHLGEASITTQCRSSESSRSAIKS
ncbi:hypothetical protein CAPTEDRAFT_228338 [Capitella teleta]|uniref:Uncharacterized protein n=1 Tax=Capitella teleta TaxID=283909 RepID=R7VKK3_CAPTE|nr:hypothetical protein CAPTEDRAFT_228338 [Capitella teleta]|eukprot:ELU17446.1 hypothetical protein CAPTEDRAFT_228338 [Capitella teleta]